MEFWGEKPAGEAFAVKDERQAKREAARKEKQQSDARDPEKTVTDVWHKYEAGVEHHRAINLYRETEKRHKFYEGDQWAGLKSGNEEMPAFNFIKPVTRYKVATVATNTTAIMHTSLAKDEISELVCSDLNDIVAKLWEQLKMDRIKWRMIKNAAIEGDHYAYLFKCNEDSESVAGVDEPQFKMRLLPCTNVYLSDEQNNDLNEQEYIIIAERKPVDVVREAAERNGIEEEQIRLITSDEVDETEINVESGAEVETKHGKCTSLLYMERTPEGIRFCRSVKNVIYEPEQMLKGLDVYPITNMLWEERSGSARGVGAVEYMIPNQITVNKTLARRAVVVKNLSFPKLAYDPERIQNPDDLNTAGARLRIERMGENPIGNMVGYIAPPAMNGDASALSNELIAMTRDLEGASSVATGQADMTNSSGEAIKAARDVSAQSVSEQDASYRQWAEDFGRLMYKLYFVYSPNGMTVMQKISGMDAMTGAAADMYVPVQITQEALQQMDIDIRVDVSSTDPYSVLSREIALENALAKQYITFEEYVDAMDQESGVPKDKFEKILQDREIAAQQAAQLAAQQAAQEQEAMMALAASAGAGTTGVQGMTNAQGTMTQAMPQVAEMLGDGALMTEPTMQSPLMEGM